MEQLKKYKTQIFNGITIFLIVTFVIYPGLTVANTLQNVMAAIGLLLLVVWGSLALFQFMFPKDTPVDKETTDLEQKWKENVEFQMKAMKEMHEQNDVLEKKSKRKSKTK